MMIFRVEGAVLYFNTEHVIKVVQERVRATETSLRFVICDLSASPYVDTAGTRAFVGLHKDLAARGIALRLVDARSGVRDILRAEGLEQLTGPIDRRHSLSDIVESINESQVETPGAGS